ncbi:hypothetical protein Tco_0053282, partial [Tanacetum coccineum]
NLCTTAAYRPVRELIQQERLKDIATSQSDFINIQEKKRRAESGEGSQSPEEAIKEKVITIRPLKMEDFREAKNQKMVNGGRVASWMCINFARNVQDNTARTFCHELAQMCNISGMVRQDPFLFYLIPCSILQHAILVECAILGSLTVSLMQAFNPDPVLPAFSGHPDQIERVKRSFS